VRAVGLDVGGTKLAAALVETTTGAVVREARRPTEARRGGAAVLADAASLAEAVAAGERAPVGIGLCEFVDRAGRPTSGVTVDWRGLDLGRAFASVGPVAVESDVRAAGLAEARFGAGVGSSAFLYVTVGTGVSFCHVLDGVPYPGARGNAIVVGAPPVETVASGKALGGSAEGSDAAAAELGAAIAALVNAFDPELVVVGGGLGLVERFRSRVVACARPLIDAEPTRGLPIVPAGLGDASGAIGAALAAPDPRPR
jgi:glucokinase